MVKLSELLCDCPQHGCEHRCFICAFPATRIYKAVRLCDKDWCLKAMQNAESEGSNFTGWVGADQMAENKSVLDGVPAVEVDLITGERRPLPPGKLPRPPQGGTAFASSRGVVSSCPTCGAPIYGPRTVSADTATVGINYTCNCRGTANRPKDIRDVIETK